MKINVVVNLEMWIYKNLMCKTYQMNGRWRWVVAEIVSAKELAGGFANDADEAKKCAEQYCDRTEKTL